MAPISFHFFLIFTFAFYFLNFYINTFACDPVALTPKGKGYFLFLFVFLLLPAGLPTGSFP